MRRVFISDLHLDAPDSPAFARFGELLTIEAARSEEIYILGDLVEMWVGDDDDTPTAERLREVLRRTTQRCAVQLMHGNRDFLFAERFAADTGVTLIHDPLCTGDGLLLTHGDALCTDDAEYQAMRAMFRNEDWQRDILSKSLAERQAFGAALRMQSQQNNANKPTNIMDVNQQAAARLLQQHDAHTLLHGHTHRPGIHRLGSGQRIVTGAWERCGWLVRQRDASLQLECFSLARRYGT